ncbi:MAG TPA: nuclear transport factor 2 family protein [Vicinamibacterales bacterium]|nr:nuclear transport factor 2 family protein [Vicinamibacterales bacterium]
MKPRGLAVLIVVLSVSFAARVGVASKEEGAQNSTAPRSLTALDYVELQQLVARYAWANDTCGHNGYDYADLYTDDGWFSSMQNGKLGQKFQGRDRLAEAAGGASRNCQKLQRPNGLWIHDIVNLVIEPSGDGAVGKSRLVYPSLRGVSFDAVHAGHVGGYEYVFARTAKGWRFKSVVHVMDHQM